MYYISTFSFILAISETPKMWFTTSPGTASAHLFHHQPTRVCLLRKLTNTWYVRVIHKHNINICAYIEGFEQNLCFAKNYILIKRRDAVAGSEWQTSNAERSASTTATMYSFNLSLTAAHAKHLCCRHRLHFHFHHTYIKYCLSIFQQFLEIFLLRLLSF